MLISRFVAFSLTASGKPSLRTTPSDRYRKAPTICNY